jgi:hypothetical protein
MRTLGSGEALRRQWITEQRATVQSRFRAARAKTHTEDTSSALLWRKNILLLHFRRAMVSLP